MAFRIKTPIGKVQEQQIVFMSIVYHNLQILSSKYRKKHTNFTVGLKMQNAVFPRNTAISYFSTFPHRDRRFFQAFFRCFGMKKVEKRSFLMCECSKNTEIQPLETDGFFGL